jgi:predicted GH43/DUF377 family glycosyl hydrolase
MKKVTVSLALWGALMLFVGMSVAHAQPGFGQIWGKSSQNPFFSSIGSPGSWNGTPAAKGLILGHGLWDDPEYKLYVGGYNVNRFSIGLVTSPALESGWGYHPNNPLLTGAPGEWDEIGVGNAMVIKDEGIYKMWYTGVANDPGYTERIGYATSPDGITWTKYANNPVLDTTPGGAWENKGVWMPYVIKQDSIYKMWYGGFSEVSIDHFSIGYATSADGIAWTKANVNPVLTHGNLPGTWDQYLVMQPIIFYDEGKYLMWFTGGVNENTPPFQSGFAISDDGISWTKDTLHNPVLPCGSAGAWDVGITAGLQVFKEGGTYKMLYLGSNLSTYFGVGLATLVTTGIDDFLPQLPGNVVLYQNYPNPFNPATNIGFRIADRGFVTLKVYDISGREVATLISENLTAGNYEYTWDARGLASGVYFYKLQAGNSSTRSEQGFVQTKKMLLIR